MAKKNIGLISILKKDRELFHKVMCWYSLIEKSDTNKSLNKKYPPSFTSDITGVFAKAELMAYASHAEFNKHDKPKTETYLFYVSDKSKCIDLLRHLRNAIAHDLITYDKKKKAFAILDYNTVGKLTAEGNIEAEKMYQVIDKILVESDIKNK